MMAKKVERIFLKDLVTLRLWASRLPALWILLWIALSSTQVLSQRHPGNYDEALVPSYMLPALPNTLEDWEKQRPTVLQHFEQEVYGRIPRLGYEVTFEVTKEVRGVLAGKADMTETTIRVTTSGGTLPIHVLLLTPTGSGTPLPAILGINFFGNHSVHHDPNITLSKQWMRKRDEYGIVDHMATERSRGVRAHRWSINRILGQGYAFATFYYGDVDPDFDDGFRNGVHSLVYKKDQSRPGPAGWGSIGAWAWGASRVLDYLQQLPEIDESRVALFGHSRLGKTALWAGAQDQRFAAVISNNSGCGGAALSRRKFGETVAIINNNQPHWFCENFKKYSDREEALPIDQHQLIALIAPRPVYIASASEDLWADPKGEFLATAEAGKVYELYGKKGLGTRTFPPANQPVIGDISYHLRNGKHDVTDYDWKQFLTFLDLHFKSH